MLANIRNTVEKYHMLGAAHGAYDKKIIIALSGGADSVSLLYAFDELKEEFGVTIEACHVNHKLRGEQSDSDEKFVRALCERLGIKLYLREVDVKALQKKHQSLEECAREARYSYFREIGTRAVIATAHTANDNTETVLLNLIRGTALRGLCGIPPVRANIIRPLIEVTRERVLAYLEEKGADYVTDESNFSKEFTRNNLRLDVIPALEKINPSLNDGITRMCETLRRDEEYLRKDSESALESAYFTHPNDEPENECFKTDVLIKQPEALLNRIISLILSKNNISPTNHRINGVVSILERGGKINLEKNKFAVVRNNLLCVKQIHQNYRKKS